MRIREYTLEPMYKAITNSQIKKGFKKKIIVELDYTRSGNFFNKKQRK